MAMKNYTQLNEFHVIYVERHLLLRKVLKIINKECILEQQWELNVNFVVKCLLAINALGNLVLKIMYTKEEIINAYGILVINVVKFPIARIILPDILRSYMNRGNFYAIGAVNPSLVVVLLNMNKPSMRGESLFVMDVTTYLKIDAI